MSTKVQAVSILGKALLIAVLCIGCRDRSTGGDDNNNNNVNRNNNANGNYNSNLNNNNTNPTCDYNHVCDPWETCTSCLDCCSSDCSLSDGALYDYILDDVYFPMNSAESREIGVDLDGDGEIDNKFGQLMSVFPTCGDLNPWVADEISAGHIIFLARLAVNNWPTDDTVAVQILRGDTDPTHDPPQDNLTGSGHVLIDPPEDRSVFMCGSLSNGTLQGGPRNQVSFFMVFFNKVIHLKLDWARIVSTTPISESDWVSVMIGGGISQRTLDAEVYPQMVDAINEVIINDPTGPTWEFVRDTMDCACDSGVYDCQDVVNLQGDCSCWDHDPANPPVTTTELRCNAILYTTLHADLDIDKDEEPDVLSVGARVSAIPVTIDN